MLKTICIDYDGSFTDFPELFDRIIRSCKGLGYCIILATMRYPDEEDHGLKFIKEQYGIDIIYTSRLAKKPFLACRNIHPDLWIDDQPEWIIHDAIK
jgi:DNA-binding LacI/PurR family transcriptional regulator